MTSRPIYETNNNQYWRCFEARLQMVLVKTMDLSRGLLILGCMGLCLIYQCTSAPIYGTDYEDVHKVKVADLFVINPDREGDNTVVDIESDECGPFLFKHLNKFIACLKSRSSVQARQVGDVGTPPNNRIIKRSPPATDFTRTSLSHSSMRPEAASPHPFFGPQHPAIGRASLQARGRTLVPGINQEGNGASDAPLLAQIGNLYILQPHEVEGNAVIQLDMDDCEKLISRPFSEYLECVKKHSADNTDGLRKLPKHGTRQTSRFLKKEETPNARQSFREPGTQGWNAIPVFKEPGQTFRFLKKEETPNARQSFREPGTRGWSAIPVFKEPGQTFRFLKKEETPNARQSFREPGTRGWNAIPVFKEPGQTFRFLKKEETPNARQSFREPGTQGWNAIQSFSKQHLPNKIPFQYRRNFANGYSGRHSIAAQEMMMSPISHRKLVRMKPKGIYPKWNVAQRPRRPLSLMHRRMLSRRSWSQVPESVGPVDHSATTVFDRPGANKEMLVQTWALRGRRMKGRHFQKRYGR
uniref:uncharacterized protein isoform X2 n=1 Tax=Myxine glutinosa TaxID=7769 RepID=UPI00358F0502